MPDNTGYTPADPNVDYFRDEHGNIWKEKRGMELLCRFHGFQRLSPFGPVWIANATDQPDECDYVSYSDAEQWLRVEYEKMRAERLRRIPR